MKTYSITIQNLYADKSRTITVNGGNVQEAHKRAYFKELTADEEIVSMEDSTGKEVFDIRKGFKS
tara:strand:- start:68 stop:262 length:195 start_codon:yes stop_codon:yes gene_type:complete